MLTASQISAGQKVQQRLAAVETAHPGSRPVALLHESLAELRDAFQTEMTAPQYTAFGGGTPKTPPGEG